MSSVWRQAIALTNADVVSVGTFGRIKICSSREIHLQSNQENVGLLVQCVNSLIIGSENGLAPSHYLNQSWNIVNLILRDKLQWNANRNSYIVSQENACENVVCRKWRPFCLGLNVLTQRWVDKVPFTSLYCVRTWPSVAYCLLMG